MRVLGNVIAVEPFQFEAPSIIEKPRLGAEADHAPDYGVVTGIGTGKEIPTELQIGNIVKCDARMGAQKYKVPNSDRFGFFVSTSDVLAIVSRD